MVANGYVVARTQASVSAKLPGRLAFLGVSEGSHVQRGQVIAGLENVADCEPVLQRLLRAAAEPIRVGAVSVQVSASMGVTLYPDDKAQNAAQAFERYDLVSAAVVDDADRIYELVVQRPLAATGAWTTSSRGR